jgi:6-phosphogluconolactonase
VEVAIESPGTLAGWAADAVEAAARSALAARRVFTLALPGGSVARAFLPALSRARLDWSRVHVFWADERAVPLDDPESNAGLARSLGFLDRVPEASVHPMPATEPDLHAAAARYESILMETAGRPAVLDTVLLGVGPDGHVASLFPGHPLLAETRRGVGAVLDAPKPPPRRLSLTLPVLTAARSVLVAAFGAEKAAVVREARERRDADSPLARVLRDAAQVRLLLDPEAAGAPSP